MPPGDISVLGIKPRIYACKATSLAQWREGFFFFFFCKKSHLHWLAQRFQSFIQWPRVSWDLRRFSMKEIFFSRINSLFMHMSRFLKWREKEDKSPWGKWRCLHVNGVSPFCLTDIKFRGIFVFDHWEAVNASDRNWLQRHFSMVSCLLNYKEETHARKALWECESQFRRAQSEGGNTILRKQRTFTLIWN